MTGQKYDRIGDILRRHDELTDEQVAAVLEIQAGEELPFGEIAQRRFGVSPAAVERAWVQQYLGYGTRIDLSSSQVDTEVLSLLSRREAWQFRIMPIGRDEGLLSLATTEKRLARAVVFAWRRLKQPVYFWVAPEHQLKACLEVHYPWGCAERDSRVVKVEPAKRAHPPMHPWGKPNVVITARGRFARRDQKAL